MNAKKLIEDNNRKRRMLTKENEAYYSDMLVYIRLQLTLSEQQSEEVLMEMLDHLLDAQAEGKSAKDIFGEDPKEYAEEIIAQLPKEERRKIIPFVAGIIFDTISWLFMIRGLVIFIVSQFKEVDTKVYPFVAGTNAFLLISVLFFLIWYIFKVIKDTLFTDKLKSKLTMVKVGLVGAVAGAIVILTMRFLPKIGPSFELSWWLSLLIGAVIWSILFIFKKRKGN